MFLVKCTFQLRERGLFVMSGEVVEGPIRAGMFVHLPMNASLRLTAPIDAIEVAWTGESTQVCLCFKGDSEALAFLTGLNIGADEPEMVEVSETGQR